MFGLLRFLFRLTGILLLIALIGAYFTNPTEKDFSIRAEQLIKEHLTSLDQGNLLEILTGGSSPITAEVIESLVVRKNYFVCSVFSIKVPFGPEYEYLGLYGQFVPLQEGNPLGVASVSE